MKWVNSFAFYSLPFFSIFLIIMAFTQFKDPFPAPPGDPGNGGLFLPDGFEAVVVADSVGRARHLAVSSNGDIYVKLRVPDPKGIVALSCLLYTSPSPRDGLL